MGPSVAREGDGDSCGYGDYRGGNQSDDCGDGYGIDNQHSVECTGAVAIALIGNSERDMVQFVANYTYGDGDTGWGSGDGGT